MSNFTQFNELLKNHETINNTNNVTINNGAVDSGNNSLHLERCEWINCYQVFNQPADLFNHITDAHIGRKSTNTLQLQCHWNDCGRVFDKRDHIVSHARVHVPSYRPYVCVCGKAFSRAHDLKKHRRARHGANGSSADDVSTTGDNNGTADIRNNSPVPVTPLTPTAPPSMSFIDNSRFVPLSVQPATSSSTNTTKLNTLITSANNLSSDAKVMPKAGGPLSAPADRKRASELMDTDYALLDFLGSIKRKKLAPQYSKEIRDTLNSIVENVVAPRIPMDVNLFQPPPEQQLQQQYNVQRNMQQSSLQPAAAPHHHQTQRMPPSRHVPPQLQEVGPNYFPPQIVSAPVMKAPVFPSPVMAETKILDSLSANVHDDLLNLEDSDINPMQWLGEDLDTEVTLMVDDMNELNSFLSELYSDIQRSETDEEHRQSSQKSPGVTTTAKSISGSSDLDKDESPAFESTSSADSLQRAENNRVAVPSDVLTLKMPISRLPSEATLLRNLNQPLPVDPNAPSSAVRMNSEDFNSLFDRRVSGAIGMSDMDHDSTDMEEEFARDFNYARRGDFPISAAKPRSPLSKEAMSVVRDDKPSPPLSAVPRRVESLLEEFDNLSLRSLLSPTTPLPAIDSGSSSSSNSSGGGQITGNTGAKDSEIAPLPRNNLGRLPRMSIDGSTITSSAINGLRSVSAQHLGKSNTSKTSSPVVDGKVGKVLKTMAEVSHSDPSVTVHVLANRRHIYGKDLDYENSIGSNASSDKSTTPTRQQQPHNRHAMRKPNPSPNNQHHSSEDADLKRLVVQLTRLISKGVRDQQMLERSHSAPVLKSGGGDSSNNNMDDTPIAHFDDSLKRVNSKSPIVPKLAAPSLLEGLVVESLGGHQNQQQQDATVVVNVDQRTMREIHLLLVQVLMRRIERLWRQKHKS